MAQAVFTRAELLPFEPTAPRPGKLEQHPGRVALQIKNWSNMVQHGRSFWDLVFVYYIFIYCRYLAHKTSLYITLHHFKTLQQKPMNLPKITWIFMDFDQINPLFPLVHFHLFQHSLSTLRPPPSVAPPATARSRHRSRPAGPWEECFPWRLRLVLGISDWIFEWDMNEI